MSILVSTPTDPETTSPRDLAQSVRSRRTTKPVVPSPPTDAESRDRTRGFKNQHFLPPDLTRLELNRSPSMDTSDRRPAPGRPGAEASCPTGRGVTTATGDVSQTERFREGIPPRPRTRIRLDHISFPDTSSMDMSSRHAGGPPLGAYVQARRDRSVASCRPRTSDGLRRSTSRPRRGPVALRDRLRPPGGTLNAASPSPACFPEERSSLLGRILARDVGPPR